MNHPSLVALFQWIRSEEGTECPQLDDTVLSAQAYKELREKIFKNRKLLNGSEKSEVVDPQSGEVDANTLWFEDLVVEQSYCSNLLQLLVATLVKHPKIAANPTTVFNTLWERLFANHSKEAIAWFLDESNQEKISEMSQELCLSIKKQVMEQYLIETRSIFRIMTKPASLIPLFREHYVNPQRIAAFIIVLLESKVSESSLIKSGLLHEYFIAHIGFAKTNDNPVTQLYQMLNLYSVSAKLLSKIKTVSVMTSDGSNSDFSNYTVDGIHHSHEEDQQKLQKIALKPYEFNELANSESFKLLYELFGSSFLLGICLYYSKHKTEQLELILKEQLNSNNDQFRKELGRFMKVLAIQGYNKWFSFLADILDESTINDWIDSGNFLIFHLLPYKEISLDKINATKIQTYLDSIDAKDYLLDHLLLLSVLLEAFINKNGPEDCIALLFGNILDIFLNNRHLYDSRVIYYLQKASSYSSCDELLQIKLNDVLSKFNSSFKPIIDSKELPTDTAVNSLKDTWKKGIWQYELVLEIMPELKSKDFPRNEYALYIQIVKALAEKIKNHYVLKQIIEFLYPEEQQVNPELIYLEESLSESERFLIQLMLATRDEQIWTLAIHLLENRTGNPINWLKFMHDWHPFIDLAIKNENIELINFLAKKIINPITMLYILCDKQFAQSLKASIYADLEKRLIDLYLEKFRHIFASERYPANIIPLFVAYFDEPHHIAAFLVLVLGRGVSSEEIIKSCILHQYYKHSPSSVAQLYKILSTQPIALALVEQARLVSVQFNNEKNTKYERISLDGTDYSNDRTVQLRNIEPNDDGYAKVSQLVNFKNMHSVFGTTYLHKLFQCLLELKVANAGTILKTNLNDETAVSLHEFSTFVNWVARYQFPRSIECLVGILNFDRIDEAMRNNTLTNDALLKLFKKVNEKEHRSVRINSIIIIFNKLLDKLDQTNFLEYERTIADLQLAMDLYQCKESVQKRADSLSSKLSTYIENQVSSLVATIDKEKFAPMISVWEADYKLYSILKKLHPNMSSDYPESHSEFGWLLFKSLLVKFNGTIDLQKTLSIVFARYNGSYIMKRQIEDKLIELIISNEDERIWSQMINIFENNKNLEWLEQIIKYSKTHDKNSLILYIADKCITNAQVISKLTQYFLEKQQWDPIKNIVSSRKAFELDVELVVKVCISAAEDKKLAYIFTPTLPSSQPGFFKEVQGSDLQLSFDSGRLLAELVVHDEVDIIKELLTISPYFLKCLLIQVKISDEPWRTFDSISGFQYALWAMNWDLCKIILESLQQASNNQYSKADMIRNDMYQQYQSVIEKGVECDYRFSVTSIYKFFDLSKLVDELDHYLQKYPPQKLKSLRTKMEYEDDEIRHWNDIKEHLNFIPRHIDKVFCKCKPNLRTSIPKFQSAPFTAWNSPPWARVDLTDTYKSLSLIVNDKSKHTEEIKQILSAPISQRISETHGL